MHKKSIFILFISALFLLSFVSAQLQSTTINQGKNFETSCLSDRCTTTIYSYDKYFNRNNVWEEIDENWYQCENNFCTKNYYFNATANQDGTIIMQLGRRQFAQQISNFRNLNLTFSQPAIQGSVLTYQDILPNIDLKYQYLPHKLKEEIVIKEPIQNLPQEDFEITFSISGNANFNLELPFICDSNRKCRPINYTISQNHISLIIPSRFLNSETTLYPVTIDPSFSISNSSIIWNGVAYEYDDGEMIGYFRISNPTTLQIGAAPNAENRGDIDWNLDSIPSTSTINSATLKLFFEELIAPNVVNIVHMGKNSSEWSDDFMGNLGFWTDMQNGTIYSNYSSTFNSTNVLLNFTFNQQGIDDIKTAFITSKRFSLGINADPNRNVTILARDNANASRRPMLIIQTKEDYNLTYDANGNMIQGFGKYMEYDAWNRLSKIRANNATGNVIAEYLYDHEGKRIKKIVYNPTGNGHNESTYYMNTRPADFIQVINTNGTIINETYIYLQDKIIAKIDNDGKKFFYHPDHLGSTSLVTNESGDVVEDLIYLPFGGVLSGTESSRFIYTGKEKDQESDFEYYGARYYDPRFGRFLECDPVKSNIYDPQALNCYSYVLNNPYKYVDPNGETPLLIIAGAIGTVIAFDYATEIIKGTLSGQSFQTSYEQGAQRAGTSIGNIEGAAVEIASSIAPSEILRRASLAKDIVELIRDVSDKKGSSAISNDRSYSGNENQKDDKTEYKYTDEYGNEREFKDYDDYLMYLQSQQLINQQNANEEGGERANFADVGGNVPGPSGSGGGSSGSSSSSGSTGNSPSGSNSGSSGGGGHWWCFGGRFC